MANGRWAMKMRRFMVWLDKQVVGCEPSFDYIDFPDDTPDNVIETECAALLDIMIGNELDTGWQEEE
jgi:hypothetical protein